MSLLPPPRTNQRRLYAARGGVGGGEGSLRRKIPGINRLSESKEEGGKHLARPRGRRSRFDWVLYGKVGVGGGKEGE